MIEINAEASSWKADAKCAGMTPTMFEIPDIIGGFSDEEKTAIEYRLHAGIKVCEECPVRQECLDASDLSDRSWTIRGGKMPTAIGFKDPARERGGMITSGPYGAVDFSNPIALAGWIERLKKGRMWKSALEAEDGVISECVHGHLAPRYHSGTARRCVVCFCIEKNVRRRRNRALNAEVKAAARREAEAAKLAE